MLLLFMFLRMLLLFMEIVYWVTQIIKQIQSSSKNGQLHSIMEKTKNFQS